MSDSVAKIPLRPLIMQRSIRISNAFWGQSVSDEFFAAGEITTMNPFSIRMILFIVVLSALHISAIAPRPPAIQSPQEASVRPLVQTRNSISLHQVTASQRL
jgi:hypothetical protein